MNCESLGGKHYYLLMIDDFSRMKFIYFLEKKNEALDYFKTFKAEVENQAERKIKILRSDNGGEYTSNEFENFLSDAGIIHQVSTPHTPQQNGVSERANRTIVEMVRCMLNRCGLPTKFWAEAANAAVYILNRTI